MKIQREIENRHAHDRGVVLDPVLVLVLVFGLFLLASDSRTGRNAQTTLLFSLFFRHCFGFSSAMKLQRLILPRWLKRRCRIIQQQL